MKIKLTYLFDIVANKNVVLHILIYIFLVFVAPVVYKTTWLYVSSGWPTFDIRLFLYIVLPSFTVIIADTIQLLIWYIFSKISKFSIRKTVIIYVYNKLLLPFSGILILIKVNASYSMLNTVYMFIFSILFFNLIEFKNYILRIVANMLLLFLITISIVYVYQIFY